MVKWALLFCFILAVASEATNNISPAGSVSKHISKSDQRAGFAQHLLASWGHELSAAAGESSSTALRRNPGNVVRTSQTSVSSTTIRPHGIGAVISASLPALISLTIVWALQLFGVKDVVLIPSAVLIGTLILYRAQSQVESALHDQSQSHKLLESMVQSGAKRELDTWQVNKKQKDDATSFGVLVGVLCCIGILHKILEHNIVLLFLGFRNITSGSCFRNITCDSTGKRK